MLILIKTLRLGKIINLSTTIQLKKNYFARQTEINFSLELRLTAQFTECLIQ